MSRHAGTRPARDLDLLLEGGSVVVLDDGSLLDRVVSSPSPLAEAAFEALIRRHGSMVARVCGAILVGDSHAAEDATQAVFLVLARRAASIRNPDRLGPWLHGVALRTAREARNRAARRRRKLLEHSENTANQGADMIDPRQDPTRTLILREQAELLHRAIARLPSRYLAPVILCDLEGLTHAEAASRLHCPVSTVSIRLKRAREQLRTKLARHHLDFESAIGPAVLSLPRTLFATAGAQILANRVAWTTSAAKWKAAIVAALVAGVAAVGAQGNNPDSPPAKPIVPPLEASKPHDPPAIKPTAPPEVPKEEEDKVKIGLPTVRDVVDYEEFIGRIVASRVVEIRPQIGGIIRYAADITDGDPVEKGQSMFGIDNPSHQAQLRERDPEVFRAAERVRQAEGVAARIEAERPRRLSDADIRMTRERFNDSKRDYERILERFHTSYEQQNMIVAPFAGQVARRVVDIGETVEAGKTVLAVITAVDPIRVDFEIDERNFLKIRKWLRTQPGTTHLSVHVGLVDETGFPHPGRVLFQTARFSPETGTCTLHAELPNADRALIPGLFARVRVDYGDPHLALLVPEGAILTDQGRKYVRVVDDQDIAQLRPIQVGPLFDGLREIKGGIDAKSRVILDCRAKIEVGAKVPSPVEAAPK